MTIDSIVYIKSYVNIQDSADYQTKNGFYRRYLGALGDNFDQFELN